MNVLRRIANGFDVAPEIRSLARPLMGPDDLDPLVDRVGANRFVCVGEASHGTHEYYRWRAQLCRPYPGTRLQLDRGRGRLARLLADQPLGAGPGTSRS